MIFLFSFYFQVSSQLAAHPEVDSDVMVESASIDVRTSDVMVERASIDVRTAITNEFEHLADSIADLNVTSESSGEDDDLPHEGVADDEELIPEKDPEPLRVVEIEPTFLSETHVDKEIAEFPFDEAAVDSNKLRYEESDIESVTSDSTSTIDSMSTVEVRFVFFRLTKFEGL